MMSDRDPEKALLYVLYEPYPQLRHNIKMAALWWGQCTESIWRG